MTAHDLAERLAVSPNDHEACSSLALVEAQIDEVTGRLWGIREAELNDIASALALITTRARLLPAGDIPGSLQSSLAI
jgi:hypothetical protein